MSIDSLLVSRAIRRVAAAAPLSIALTSPVAHAQARPPAPADPTTAGAPWAGAATTVPWEPASPPVAWDSLPIIDAKPILIDFGRQLVYQASATPSKVVISNLGPADLIISLISDPMEAGKTQDQFQVTKPQVYPLTIARVDPFTQKGGSLEVSVNYRPTQAGPYNGIIEVSSNDSRSPRTVVNLHGEGIDTPIVPVVADALDAKVLDFGAYRIDPNRAALPRKTVILKNVGPAEVSVSDATIKGITVDHFNVYPVVGRSQTGSIASGRSATVDIEFKVQPSISVSTALAEFTVFGTGLKPVVMPITGQTVDTLFIFNTDEKVDGGATVVSRTGVSTYRIEDALGTPTKHTVTVSNATRYSQTVATIESDNPTLVLENTAAILGQTLDPGRSVTFQLRFEPRRLGTETGTLTLRAKGVDGPDATLDVTATAVEPPLGGRGVACAVGTSGRGRFAALPLTIGTLLASALGLRRRRRSS